MCMGSEVITESTSCPSLLVSVSSHASPSPWKRHILQEAETILSTSLVLTFTKTGFQTCMNLV